jgi:hypothetical protein
MFTSWHVKVAAEAFAAGVFAHSGFKVLVQYGADQPEYDLAVEKDGKMMKVSVKGSQTGSWGPSQSFLANGDYHAAADTWRSRHHEETVLCFVQFRDVQVGEAPRVYIATPAEVCARLKATAGGEGRTVLYESRRWGPRSRAVGFEERIPPEWRFSLSRAERLLSTV